MSSLGGLAVEWGVNLELTKPFPLQAFTLLAKCILYTLYILQKKKQIKKKSTNREGKLKSFKFKSHKGTLLLNILGYGLFSSGASGECA